MTEEITLLKQKIAETELRHTLIARLMSAENTSQGVKDYFYTLNTDFLDFANEEDALEDEAATMLQLQEIGNELKLVSVYTDFYKKRSIAIAGGFSAGKSEFISGLFQDHSVRLPIGIEPTTAIPTYAMNGTSGVVGCSSNGGIVDLLEIDPEFQQKLSHNFIRSFGFNLKNIMPFVFLTTSMAYEHLCFVDTPGYNPSDAEGGYTSEDVNTAKDFVNNAEALIWLIGLDSNGTISQSDLNFLEAVTQNSTRPLYIVLNKADIRPLEQLEDIMDEISDTLDDYGITTAGISAYSSVMQQEYTFRQQSLTDFLAEMDTPSDKHHTLLERLLEVDRKYQYAILRDIKESKQIGAMLNGLKLDLLQQGFDDIGSPLYSKISKMNALFSPQHQAEQLKKLAKVTERLAAAIDSVFGQPAPLQRQTLTEDDVQLSEKYSRLTEKDEIPEELEELVNNEPSKGKLAEKQRNRETEEQRNRGTEEQALSVGFYELFKILPRSRE